MAGTFNKPFPKGIPKTREQHIFKNPTILLDMQGHLKTITLKMDGWSATYIKEGNNFTVCSRNFIIPKGNNIYWEMAKKYKLAGKIPNNSAIQCEICGPDIQMNRLGLKEPEIYVYDWYLMDKFWHARTRNKAGTYSGYYRMVSMCKNIKLPTVPILLPVNKKDRTLAELQDIADGTVYPNGHPGEGIVVRTQSRGYSGKVINSKYGA